MINLKSSGSSLQEIRQIKQSKQIESQFDRVCQLLNQLTTTEEMAQAGQMLKKIDYSELALNYANLNLRQTKIAVIGNFVLDSIKPFLNYFHLREQIFIDTYFADYGQYIYEILNTNSSLYKYQPEILICLLDEHFIFDELKTPWHLSDLEALLQEKLQELEKLITQYNSISSGLLVLNTIPLSQNRTNQILDYKSKASLGYLWKNFNAQLLKISNQFSSLIVIDIDPLLANAQGLVDNRLSQYAKIHMTESLLCSYSFEISKISRLITGRVRKCLVLDLDNTLWKGILGDDGIEGIEVSDTLIGEAYHQFQLTIKQLASQGVLLTINSKNDLEKVKKVLNNHSKMVLREEDFVYICANWIPKHENLKEIAQSLNIGLDSFIFVDDSDFERNLIRSKQKNVMVVELEKEQATFSESLLTGGWLNKLELTKEDHSRTQKYKHEDQRKTFLSKFDSIDDYLQELELKVRLFTPQSKDLPRISQLTLRTNQFNMTTTRYQESEIRQLSQDPSIMILGIESEDRFGDHGIVGCIFLRRPKGKNHEIFIDNFLLSCRVFSRGIETISLETVLQKAQLARIEKVYAEYIPSPKNQKVRDFYKTQHFEIIEETSQRILYEKSLKNKIAISVTHINLSSENWSFSHE